MIIIYDSYFFIIKLTDSSVFLKVMLKCLNEVTVSLHLSLTTTFRILGKLKMINSMFKTIIQIWTINFKLLFRSQARNNYLEI